MKFPNLFWFISIEFIKYLLNICIDEEFVCKVKIECHSFLKYRTHFSHYTYICFPFIHGTCNFGLKTKCTYTSTFKGIV